jgi:hypothetical protein
MRSSLKRFFIGLLLILSISCFAADFPKSYFTDHLTTAWKTDKILIVLAPLGYQSETLGYIEVPAGFVTDLASIPRLPLIYQAWGGRASASAVIHDYLYRNDSIPLVTFQEANIAFLEAMESLGTSTWVRYPLYWGVCAFGWGSYHKRSIRAELF